MQETRGVTPAHRGWIGWTGMGLIWFVPGFLGALDYERDIMPIFVEKCADCHSAQSEKVKGGLRLDDPDHVLERLTKNSLVVPGDWDASYLFITVFRPPGDEDAMPPKGKGEHLNREEVRLVMEWIAEGAPIGGTKGEEGPMPDDVEALLAHLEPGSGGGAASPGQGPVAGPVPVERDWVNLEGKVLRATLLRVEGDVALLRVADGRIYRYPIANLAAESRAWLETGEMAP